MKKSVHNVQTHLLMIFVCLVFAFPFIWMVLSSFMTTAETTSIPITLFPKDPQWENYTVILDKFPIVQWHLNSLFVMGISIAFQLVFASMAAYAFARLRFRGKEVLFVCFLSLMMIPEQIFILPRYYLLRDIGLGNTLTGLWLPKIFPVFAVFMLRQFFSSLPMDLDEAAKIDGCGRFRIYARILLPLLKGPMISLSILQGLAIWKDLMWPIIMIRDNDKKTVVAGLAVVQDLYDGQFNYTMVAGVLGSIMMIVIFFFLQKRIVKGIASEGLKG